MREQRELRPDVFSVGELQLLFATMSPIIKKSVSFNRRLTSSRSHMGAICKLFPLDLHWVHSPVCIDMEYMCKQCLADQAVSGLRSVPARGRYTPSIHC